MSNQPNRRNALISAALRHVRDAEHLAATGPAQSLDQAFHLVGFGPECGRKACLHEAWADKAIGHAFGRGAEELLGVALSLDGQAHRYRPSEWHEIFPALKDWDVGSRYWATGAAGVAKTQALLADARCAVDTVVAAMWSDGVIDVEALQ